MQSFYSENSFSKIADIQNLQDTMMNTINSSRFCAAVSSANRLDQHVFNK